MPWSWLGPAHKRKTHQQAPGGIQERAVKLREERNTCSLQSGKIQSPVRGEICRSSRSWKLFRSSHYKDVAPDGAAVIPLWIWDRDWGHSVPLIRSWDGCML